MRKEKLEELNKIIEELKTIKKEIMKTNSKFLTVENYNVTLNNGKVIYREKLLKGNSSGSAAVILPILENGDVILAVEPRVFINSTVGVGLPAGYIEEGELPIKAAERELLEETGYISNNFKYLGGYYQDTGVSGAYNELYLALNCRYKQTQKLDQGEEVKYFICYFSEALELIDMGYINGSNAIITLERAKKHIKRRI